MKRRMAARRWALVVSLLAMLAPGFEGTGIAADPEPYADETAQPWKLYESSDFHVYSRAPVSDTKQIIRKLEMFRQYMAAVTPFKATLWAPIEVIILPDLASYEYYSDLPNTAGFFQSTPDRNYICICSDPRIGSDDTIYHEFTHYLLHNTFATIPLWADEGLAEFFSGFKISGTKVQTGLPKGVHVAWLREHSIIPFESLMQIDTKSPQYREGESQGTLYAQSWAITHYLMRDASNNHGDGLLRYLQEVGNGGDPAEMLPVCLGKTPERLDTAVANYVTRREYTVGEFDLEDASIPENPELKSVAPGEILTELGAFLARTQHLAPDIVEGTLDDAETAGGSQGEIDLARTWLYAANNKEEQALALVQNLVEREPVNWSANFALGTLQTIAALKNPDLPERTDDSLPPLVAKARNHLSLCANLKPDFERGLVALGETYLFESRPDPQGIAVLESAMALSPGDNDALAVLGILYARSGDIERAKRLVANRLGRLANPALAGMVEAEILNRQQDEVINLLQDNRPEEALAKLKEQRQAATSPEAREQLDDRIAGLAEWIARNRRIELYNTSLELARNGDNQASLIKLAELLDLCYEVESDEDSLCAHAKQLRSFLLAGKKIR